jgi:hypothetical protein
MDVFWGASKQLMSSEMASTTGGAPRGTKEGLVARPTTARGANLGDRPWPTQSAPQPGAADNGISRLAPDPRRRRRCARRPRAAVVSG